MPERLGVLLAVVECPRKGEMERRDIALVNGDGQRRAHRLDILIGEDFRLDAGKSPPCIAETVVGSDRLPVCRDSLVDLARRTQAVAISDERRCMVGVLLRQFAIHLARPFALADLLVD